MSANAIYTAEDARRIAKRRLPWMAFDYFNGAAGDGKGELRNRAALDAVTLRPRVLKNVADRTVATSVLGKPAKRPFGIAPMGMCNLAAPEADLMLARLAAKFEIPHGISTMATTPLEEVIEAADGHGWFQLYYSGDGATSMSLLDRAKAAGCETLIFTVDVPELGRRPDELRHGFKQPFRIGPRQFVDFAMHPRWSLTALMKGAPDLANFRPPLPQFLRSDTRALADWDTLARLRDAWPGRFVLKGVLDPGDAAKARDAGVDAVQVSSHGARQLESGPAPIHMLPKIRDAVGPAFPLLYDSGLRSGEDALKALITGADFVFFGRILLFAIAAGGEDGLARMWQVLSDEMDTAMAQIGLADINDRSSDLLGD
jgi:L-lactate dehydrogenase (cytochrome)